MADYMLDCVIKAEPEAVASMVAAFRTSQVAGENAMWMQQIRQQHAWEEGQQRSHDGLLAARGPDLPAKYCASFGTQLHVLSGRLVRNIYRHPMHLYLNFLATLAMAVAMGGVFWHAGVDTGGIQNRLGALFFMLLFLSLMSLSSLPVWSQDRLLFLRERAAGCYSTNAYFAATLLFDFVPLRVLPPFLFGLISYPMIGLHPRCHLCLLRFTSVLVLANLASAASCMALGLLLNSPAAANGAGAFGLLLSARLAGFFCSDADLQPPLRALARLSYLRAAYEALAINEFAGAQGFFFTSRISRSARLAVSGDQVTPAPPGARGTRLRATVFRVLQRR